MMIAKAFLKIVLIVLISLYASFTFAYVATLSWNAPTKNADGTPLTDLAGYGVYYGTSSHNYSKNVNVGSETTYKATNLQLGVPYYFAVTAYDSSGNESKYSNEARIIRYALKVENSGTGEGTVTSSPAGINCGFNCKEIYNSSTVVALTATPQTASTFTGWSGGGCTGKGQCIVSINTNTTVKANFSSETSVAVTSPNGGETLKSGSIYTIRWTTNATNAPVAKVRLSYTTNGGSAWNLIDTLTSNLGSYNWNVPNVSSSSCKVRIVLRDASRHTVGRDMSDGFFTIQP
jgi:hypothetical protein